MTTDWIVGAFCIQAQRCELLGVLSGDFACAKKQANEWYDKKFSGVRGGELGVFSAKPREELHQDLLFWFVNGGFDPFSADVMADRFIDGLTDYMESVEIPREAG